MQLYNNYMNKNKQVHIQPFTKRKLDCYQSLIATILEYKKCNVDLLGATWPWLFSFRNTENGKIIINEHLLKDERIKSLYGYNVVTGIVENTNIKQKLIQLLSVSPVIINLDQYFIPYHYVHIYKKVHGQHSLLITNYNNKIDSFYCVDTLPEYKGYLNFNIIKDGIINFPYKHVTHNYCILEESKSNIRINDNELYCKFLESLNTYENIYSNDEVFSIPGLVKLLKDNLHEKDSLCWLTNITNGTWLWEIDRKPNWTIAYLKSKFLQKTYSNEKIDELCGFFEQSNEIILASMRFLYKASILNSKSHVEKCIMRLEDSVKIQNKIITLIRNKGDKIND